MSDNGHKAIRVNFDDLHALKVREIIELEELTGSSVMDLFQAGAPMGKTLQGVAYVLAKRDNPDITFDDALDIEVSLEDVAVDPQKAAG